MMMIIIIIIFRRPKKTRNSAIADKPRDAFRGKSPNMVPLWFPISVL